MPKKKRRIRKRKKVAKRRVLKKKTAKKRVVKRAKVKKRVAVKKPVAAKPQGKVIGKVTHYFPKVRAAVIKMKAPLVIGDVVKIKGHTTDFKQKVTSMQIDRVPITAAKKGDEIGLLVASRVRGNDVVYKV